MDTRRRTETSAHEGVTCNFCNKTNFTGARYKCLECKDYTLCKTCYMAGETNFLHKENHLMDRIFPTRTERPSSNSYSDRRPPLEVYRPSPNDEYNEGIQCDVCLTLNFRGPRYKCLTCIDYDMCGRCYKLNSTNLDHLSTHRMEIKITKNLRIEFNDKWEIPRSEIQLESKLGEGRFGESFSAKWKNMEIAVKTLKKGTLSSKDFLRVANVMKRIRNPWFVQVYAVCSREEPYYIIQEYVSNGCLSDYLRKHNENSLHLDELINISYTIAKGMEYLEDKDLIHRDLAARTILVGKRNTIKIYDFGLARAIFNKDPEKCFPFPVKWTAPEDILDGKCSTKSDVWSYGIVLMEIFSYGGVPYPGMSDEEVMNKVQNGYRMDRPKHATTKFYNLMLKCWNYDLKKRPTFKSILNLEFMEDTYR